MGVFLNKMDKPAYGKKQQERAPLLHYTAIYKTLDPGEIARRCALPFDRDSGAFSLRLMGTEYRAAFPDFSLIDGAGAELQNPWEKILVLRYLCTGKYFESQGKQLSYLEIPWGTVYYPNFRGRCINRFAAVFGRDLGVFREIMEKTPELRARALDQGDAECQATHTEYRATHTEYRAISHTEYRAISHVGYRFEFMTGLFMSLLLWAGDDEFPPSAQILFDDNFVFAFTAEDLAAVAEAVITRLKEMGQKRGGFL
jgi:hypothetical protein